MMCSGTPSALACGSRCSSQVIATVARICSGELPVSSSSASMPWSSSARSPDRLAGPELSNVSDVLGICPASAASRAISPPNECPSR
jgi:hypothetical protein